MNTTTPDASRTHDPVRGQVRSQGPTCPARTGADDAATRELLHACSVSLEGCTDLAKRERVVLTCCHRSLIAGALLARGINASEITSRLRTRPHSLTPSARVDGVRVTYPDPGTTQSSAETVPTTPAVLEPPETTRRTPRR